MRWRFAVLGALIVVAVALTRTCGDDIVPTVLPSIPAVPPPPAVEPPATELRARAARPAPETPRPVRDPDTPGEYVVRVLDLGRPVEGAEVRFRDPDPLAPPPRGPMTTDKDGIARLRAQSPCVVFVEKADRANFAYLAEAGQHDLELRAAIHVRGQVVDAAGQPVPRAIVTSSFRTAEAAELPPLHVLTSDDGRFGFPRIPRAVSGNGFGWVSARAGERTASALFLEDDEAPDVRIVFGKAVRVVGRTVDGAGKPVYSENTDGHHRKSDADGRFVIEPATSPGRALLAPALSGAGLGNTLVVWTGDGPEIDVGDVVLAPPRALTGTFVHADAMPAGKVLFRLRPAGGPPVANGVHTAADWSGDGRFTVRNVWGGELSMDVMGELPLPDGVAAPKGAKLSAWKTVERVHGGDDLRVVLEPNPLLLVHATDASGAPTPFGPRASMLLEGDSISGPPVTSEGATLSYGLWGPPPWRVVVRSPGHFAVRLTIESAGPVIERTVVLRRVR